MSERKTMKNVTITFPYIHVQHILKILTKAIRMSSSTEQPPQVRFTRGVEDTVTLTITIPQQAGSIIITQHYPGSTMEYTKVSSTNMVSSETVREKLTKAIGTSGSWVSVSLPQQSVSEALFATVEPQSSFTPVSVFQMKTSAVRALRKQHSYLWSQNTVGGLVGVAYTSNGDCAQVYGTNHMLTTHYTAPIITPKNSEGSPRQCFLVLDYEVLALYDTVTQGKVSMFTYDDSTCVITDDEGASLTHVFEPTLKGGGNRVLEEKYLWGVHEDNMRGELQNHTSRGAVTFNRKVLLDRLRDAVKRADGKPSSYRLDVRVRIEQRQDVCCFTVENRGNGASSVVAPIRSAGGVVWEPTTKYHTRPENLGELEERDRYPVSYPARFFLDGLQAGRGEYVTLMPQQYFTDPLMVFCHDDPDHPMEGGEWLMLPGTMMPQSNNQEVS